jgi:hypothetical protein
MMLEETHLPPAGKDLGCLKGGYCAKEGAPGFDCRPSRPGDCEFLCRIISMMAHYLHGKAGWDTLAAHRAEF